jgi:hypothetical protein
MSKKKSLYTKSPVRKTGWAGDRTDKYELFDDRMINTIKEHGNTIIQEKVFKKTVRKLYKLKTGMSFKKYKQDYILSKDDQVRDAMAFWYEYMRTLLGFEIQLRPVDKDLDGSKELTTLVACVFIERKGIND